MRSMWLGSQVLRTGVCNNYFRKIWIFILHHFRFMILYICTIFYVCTRGTYNRPLWNYKMPSPVTVPRLDNLFSQQHWWLDSSLQIPNEIVFQCSLHLKTPGNNDMTHLTRLNKNLQGISVDLQRKRLRKSKALLKHLLKIRSLNVRKIFITQSRTSDVDSANFMSSSDHVISTSKWFLSVWVNVSLICHKTGFYIQFLSKKYVCHEN